MSRCGVAVAALLALLAARCVEAQNVVEEKKPAQAQQQLPPSAYRGLSMTSGVDVSHDSTGWTTELLSTVEYDFNKYFSLSAGIPVYFVQPYNQAAAKSTAGAQTAFNTRGDMFFDIGLKVDRNLLNYSSTVLVTAPTGDQERGVGVGQPTANWTSHFEHSWGRVTPFAEAGIGNSASAATLATGLLRTRGGKKRRARTRSYDSVGALANFQAGFDLDLGHKLSFEPAAYDLLPFGDQTLYSRLVPRLVVLPATIRHRKKRVWELVPVTRGGSSLAADHGFSGTFSYQATRRLDFSLGYTRSINYRLDTVEFSTNFRFGHVAPEPDSGNKQ